MYALAYKYVEVSSKPIFSNKYRVIGTSIEVGALIVLAILGRPHCYLFLVTLSI